MSGLVHVVNAAPTRLYSYLSEHTLCLLVDGADETVNSAHIKALAQQALDRSLPGLAVTLLTQYTIQDYGDGFRRNLRPSSCTNFEALQWHTLQRPLPVFERRLLKIVATALFEGEMPAWTETLLQQPNNQTGMEQAYRWVREHRPELTASYLNSKELAAFDQAASKGFSEHEAIVLRGTILAVVAGLQPTQFDSYARRHVHALNRNSYRILIWQEEALANLQTFDDSRWKLLLQLPEFGYQVLADLVNKIATI